MTAWGMRATTFGALPFLALGSKVSDHLKIEGVQVRPQNQQYGDGLAHRSERPLSDKHAKLAAEGRHNNSPPERLPRSLRHQTLPLSVSALKERQGKDTAERWKHLWNRSPRYYHINRIDPNILKRSFIKLTSTFSKRLTSLYVFLRTGHAPLNFHLHRIRKSDSSSCPHCPEAEETVHHYLLTCPQYRRERHLLNTALGQDSSSISFLLTDPLATPHLVKFVNATGRMRAVLGEIPTPH